MDRGKTTLAITLALFATYIMAAPFFTVYQIQSAAEKNDGEALSEYIDFPSVRQSLKDQINVMFAKEILADEDMRDNPFAALGTAFAGVMLDKMLDAYVTPAGITQLMAGENPQSGTEQGGDSDSGSERKPLKDASMSYKSIDKFVVKVEGAHGGEVEFILRRQGINWKITEVIIPLK